MARSGVEVTVGGHSYRVVASTEEELLQRYAGVVNARLRELTGNERSGHPHALLLVAIALAHDLETEREGRCRERAEAKGKLVRMLSRVDAVLDSVDEEGSPLPAAPPS